MTKHQQIYSQMLISSPTTADLRRCGYQHWEQQEKTALKQKEKYGQVNNSSKCKY